MPKPQYSSALDVRRPIMPGFYPDPSIVRVGDTFYVANSTFEYAPGVPIHSSKDLLNWKLEGHALPTAHHMGIDGMKDSQGIFAPTIRFHDGKFFMITTLLDGNWQLLVTAEHPAGPWSEPLRIDLFGIDPDLFWDDHGDCHMTYASLALGGIAQVKIDLETGKVLGEPYLVSQGTGGKFPEGPHIYKIGDWYYILLAEGGTERGHSVTIGRSKSFAGPFEYAPNSPLLTNRGTDFTIQSVGHADLAQRVDGSWVMVFHGTRPKGTSPEWHILGRETCAVEIEWRDGWPVLGSPIEPDADPVVVETLDASSDLPDNWISVGSWPVDNCTKTPDGLLFTGFVARRQTTQHFEVRLAVASEGLAGVSVVIDSRHKLELLTDSGVVSALWTIGDHQLELGTVKSAGPSVGLVIRSEPMQGGFHDPLGPDKLRCFISHSDGEEREIAALDGRYLSTEVSGGMTGRVVGIVAKSPALVKEWVYKSL